LGTTFKFSQLRALHDKGFTLLWLRPGSKLPVDKGWTKAPRQEFDAFKAEYRKGYNVGVRLGNVSRVGGKVLAVLDVDVKGSEPRHQAEANQKLFQLFPQAKYGPVVFSGRGNGSAHYYVLLPEAVSGNDRKAASSEIVKVKMPSVKAVNKTESETLTPDEIAAGIRLRPAWEVSLLCEGRQVVLPGSLHPDSGRTYEWGKGLGLDRLQMPVIALEQAKGAALSRKPILGPQAQPSAPPIEFRAVDPKALGLRDDQVAALVDGVGVTDRSASLFSLSMAMLQRKVSEQDILSVLTDRENYLGETAYDHAKTTNRQVAGRWLINYTLKRAKEQTQGADEVIEIGPEGGGAKKQERQIKEISGPGAEAFAEAGDWKKKLDLQMGPKDSPPLLRATFNNLKLILANTIGADFLRLDEFSQRQFWASDVPWGPCEGQQRSGGTEDEIKLKAWFIDVWGIEASLNMLTETLSWFAGQNSFHPVKEYLDTLSWDGVPRIDDAFKTYLRAHMPRTYLQAVSRKFFLALMARIFEPGCKFDHLPVLEGRQGIGKSTFGRILVSDKWFMDGLPDLADKDAALNLQGIWLCEMSELSSLYRSQLEVAKAFITRQTDKVRPPYGARRVEFPRSTVFVGTTNDRDYLVDSTGNRRFWPVEIHGCDFQALIRDREQLLAEAHWCYLTEMEPLYLKGAALKAAEEIQESRRVEDDSDTMADKFREWLALKPSERSIKDVTSVRLDEMFSSGPFNSFQNNLNTRKQAGSVLRKAGYNRIHTRQGKLWVASSVKKT